MSASRSGIVRVLPLSTMRLAARRSLSVRLTCTVESPVAAGVVEREVLEDALRHLSHRHRRNGAHRVVYLAQDEDVLVIQVARNQKGHDGAPPVLQLLVAAGPAREDHVDLGGVVALVNDVFAWPKHPDALSRNLLQHTFVLSREPGGLLELADERVCHGALQGVGLTY